MSGQQIGTIVGGVIGAYFGNPQLGAMIGGMIGGWVDPTKVYGPRLTDAQTQTAMDGVPMAYGYGTFPCKGNLIWQDIVKEHKHKDDGKGSGQEQITYTYTRSYAIGVCKGPISGYKIIKRNGKIVFDARTDAELSALGYTAEQIAESRAAQAKFKKVCTLYYGTDDQLPDPTMVAVKGVGNAPAYARRAYIVLTDDETMQGEVAQFEFVVANCGERTEDYGAGGKLLVTGGAFSSDQPYFAKADATSTPVFEGIARSTGANASLGLPAFYGGVWCVASGNSIRFSTSPALDQWESRTLPIDPKYSIYRHAGGPYGWVFSTVDSSIINHNPIISPLIPDSFHEYTPSILENGLPASGSPWSGVQEVAYADSYYFNQVRTTSGNLCFSASLGDAVERVWNVDSNFVLRPFYDLAMFGGKLYACSKKEFSTGRIQLVYSEDNGRSWSGPIIDLPGDVDVQYHPMELASGTNVDGDEVLIVLCPGSKYAWTSEDGFAEPHLTGISGVSASGKMIAFAAGRFYIASSTNNDSPAEGNKVVVTTDGLTFSDPISLPILGVQGIAGGDNIAGPDWEPIPDAPGYYINSTTGEVIGPPGTQVSVCKPTLGEIVSRQCAKRISTDVIDVSELTEQVVGFRIAAPSSPQKNIQALQPGYFFDGSEFDGKLRFPKRGGADSFALTVDDLCERDGDLIQWETKQEPELLRKVTVGYLDPDTTYTATTQQWERRSGTVKAEGEGVLEFPVVETKDWAAQTAHKSVKVGWAEADKCTFHTSIAQAKLVTAAVGTITDEQGTVHRVRIERIKDEGLLRMVEARRTRADVYESTLSGAAKPLPLFPGSDIRGPTDGLLLNLPVMVDSNDVPGIAWAAAGFLPAWAGGVLQFQRAGQWVDAGSATSPATMGTLLSDLPAHAGDVDTANTLHLRMNDSLESVTFTNLLQERNPLAILYDDGTAEIVQFQTATEVAAGEYELTTLLRGRLNTTAGDHAAGARTVFLDSDVHYATLQPTDVGTTLTYRFVSNGTDPDAAPVQTLDLTTMESQREWPVFDLAVEKDGDDYTVTWRKRDRLGTDVFPIRSSNWRGYEVSWSYGGNTHTETVLTESVTFNLPGASDITFSVAQLNLYTGAGPAETVTIP